MRAELEPQLGETLADVRVHRGPEVGEAARSISARAFATGGEVFLPDEHGPTNSGEGRKVLSHELTHVVQQRRLGGNLPSEDSPEGAQLEQQAREVGGQASPPVTARKLPATPSSVGSRSVGSQRMPGTMPARPARSLPASAPSAPAPSGASATDLGPGEQAAVVARIQAAAAGAGVPTEVGHSAAPDGGGTGGVQRMASPSPPASDRPTNASSPASGSTPAGAALTSATTASAAPAAATRSANELDELAGQLYPRFRSRLRNELLSDRERSGRLFDR